MAAWKTILDIWKQFSDIMPIGINKLIKLRFVLFVEKGFPSLGSFKLAASVWQALRQAGQDLLHTWYQNRMLWDFSGFVYTISISKTIFKMFRYSKLSKYSSCNRQQNHSLPAAVLSRWRQSWCEWSIGEEIRKTKFKLKINFVSDIPTALFVNIWKFSYLLLFYFL